jgi:hypothetical protein
MGIIMVETPVGKFCYGNSGYCIACRITTSGYCRHFKKHLVWEESGYMKCKECLKMDEIKE